ncbi:hypothetical protein LAJ19_16160 (plasmid) [Deinococcus taeanensis]|uniref:ATP-grasp domain-containing protein n=1 Tax=Deinococcus taeanensis TaxID=2737050 RepID=UPI001CDBDB13|nr:ATP-grasp domain-containing protein [Deinococcus taeanensis]UBV44694.1 hypothetical protein LAJ19_16160 [Deinococcus taeanensis]
MHEGLKAYCIPSASDVGAATQVVGTFLPCQGEGLRGIVVLRAFGPFAALTTQCRSRRLLTRKNRLFFVDRWVGSTGRKATLRTPRCHLSLPEETGQQVDRRLFTMAIAQREGSEWRSVNLGDDQVAGPPERAEGSGASVTRSRLAGP